MLRFLRQKSLLLGVVDHGVDTAVRIGARHDEHVDRIQCLINLRGGVALAAIGQGLVVGVGVEHVGGEGQCDFGWHPLARMLAEHKERPIGRVGAEGAYAQAADRAVLEAFLRQGNEFGQARICGGQIRNRSLDLLDVVVRVSPSACPDRAVVNRRRID